MDILFMIIAALLGGAAGYALYYRKYENRDMVNELRKTNTALRAELQSTDRDRMEYEQQNIILKDEISGLYQKNDDLTQVVSELSRYYYHMKKISDKMTDLSQDLQQPLENLDQQLKPFLYAEDDKRHQEVIHHLDESDEFDTKGFF